MVQKLIRIVKGQLKTVKQMMDKCHLFSLVSVEATKHILWEQELKGRIAAKKPALIKKHLKVRLIWSKM